MYILWYMSKREKKLLKKIKAIRLKRKLLHDNMKKSLWNLSQETKQRIFKDMDKNIYDETQKLADEMNDNLDNEKWGQDDKKEHP